MAGVIGLGATISINDGLGGSFGTFVALNNVVEFSPPKEATKFLDSSNLGSGNVQTFLESMTDPGKLMIKQEYSASDLARMKAWKKNIGLTGAYQGQGEIKFTMPDGLAVVLPCGVEDCSADQFKNEPIVTMTTNVKVTGDFVSITLPTPTVSSLTPSTGTHTGGTSVNIVGANLLLTSAVMFGMTAAASYTINSDKSITAVSPAGSAGNVYVTVTTGGQPGITGATSATGAGNQFTYT